MFVWSSLFLTHHACLSGIYFHKAREERRIEEGRERCSIIANITISRPMSNVQSWTNIRRLLDCILIAFKSPRMQRHQRQFALCGVDNLGKFILRKLHYGTFSEQVANFFYICSSGVHVYTTLVGFPAMLPFPLASLFLLIEAQLSIFSIV